MLKSAFRSWQDTKGCLENKALPTLNSEEPFLRDFGFGGQTFHWRELNALDEYVQNSEGAEHEFIDGTLESLRQKFISTYKVFRPLLPQYTAPRRFNAAVKRLRTAADQACVVYDELVRTARERLAP